MPESDYQLGPFQSSGASAASAIGTVEVGEPIEINAVGATSTASTSSAVAPDIQKNGTSIFGTNTQIGTVYQGTTAQGSTGGISSSATTLDFLPSGKPVEANSLIVIESETLLVTAVAGSNTQSPTGVGVQKLTVTRGAHGTTAASHAAGTAVYLGQPQIANGGTKIATSEMSLAVPVPFAQGDVLTVVGATGATNLAVTVDAIRV